jgi:hypothetical protein
MDPIRTAVKYSLIPLRTAVEIGERFVEGGRQTAEQPEEVQPKPVRTRRRAQRRPAKKRTTARRKPAPQASQPPKDLEQPEVREVETGQTDEPRSAVGEGPPVEAASEGEGRKPAPLGANRDGS